MKLINEIVCCPNVNKCINGDIKNPCYEIVSLQKSDYPQFYLPEPWNGNIEKANILFISSNPSIDENELYPTKNWDTEKITDFFINRFSKFVKDDKYPLLNNNNFRKTHVSFWSHIKNRSKELITDKEISLGQEVCITEIVKCKSRNELGVIQSADECAKKYLASTLKVSGAKVFIIVGSIAKRYFKKYYKIDDSVQGYINIKIASKPRHVIFLPHPNSRLKNKTIISNVDASILKLIQKDLKI